LNRQRTSTKQTCIRVDDKESAVQNTAPVGTGLSQARPRSLTMDYRHLQQRKSQHGRIVRELGMDIVSGKVQPGQRLPAEAVLCWWQRGWLYRNRVSAVS
jgi:hypothetical protein